MGVSGEVVVKLSTQSAAWTAGLGKAGADVKKFVGDAEKAFKGLTFQNGAAGFAKSFTGITKGVEGYVTALRTGESASKMFGELVNGIPIVGPFKQAGEAIGEMIFGLKAAKIEADKASEGFARIAAGYREIAFARAGLGKHGAEKARIDTDAGTASEMTKLGAERVKIGDDLRKAKGELLGLQALKNAGIAAPGMEAKRAEVDRLEKDIALNKKQQDLARDKNTEAQKEINRQATEGQRQALRQKQEDIAGFAAFADERTLKSQGDKIGAAVVAIREKLRADISAEKETVSPAALIGIDPDKAAALVAASDAKIEAMQKAADGAIADEQAEQARREQQFAAENQQELQKILREGQQARLEMVGDHLGAELARVKGAYADEVAALEKKFADERKAMNDPALLAAIAAAQEKRDASEDAAKFKDREDAYTKHLAEEKSHSELKAAYRTKLIEESATDAEKYQAKVYELKAAFNSGDLSKDRYARLLEKENNSFGASLNSTISAGNRKVGAESRRFDFAVPGTNAGPQADPLTDLNVTAKEANKILDKAQKNLDEILKYQRHADADRSTVVDF